MGIINVTPDSFSDGGSYDRMGSALERVQEMIEEGADIVDIGGESTRPGFLKVSAVEEEARVLPVVAAIKERFDVPVSVDTTKAQVAKLALELGADMINDVSGLKADPDMAAVVAGAGVPVCVMHSRDNTDYNDLIPDVIRELNECVDIALAAGIDRSRIIIDPGIGFGKTTQQNLRVIKELEQFKKLGYPLLVGASRKSVIGNTLDLPVTEREEGTIAITTVSVMADAMFIRVHDVKKNVRAMKMALAIRNA